MRVRLTTNLASYDSRLTGGQEGASVGRGCSDRFTMVQFDCGAYLEVLWGSLEIIDKEYLERKRIDDERRDEELKEATDAVLHLGPRGGFHCLSYRTKSGHTNMGDREEADRIMAIFARHSIPVKHEVQRAQPRRTLGFNFGR